MLRNHSIAPLARETGQTPAHRRPEVVNALATVLTGMFVTRGTGVLSTEHDIDIIRLLVASPLHM